MKTTQSTISPTVGFVLTVASALASETASSSLWGEAATFQNATNIVFREFTGLGTNNLGQEIPRWKQFAVSDPKEIHQFVSSLHLVPGSMEPNIEYVDEALFEQPSGTIRVSFSHGSFNIVESEHPYKNRYYPMPKEFFNEFQRLARQHGWQAPDTR